MEAKLRVAGSLSVCLSVCLSCSSLQF